MLGLLTRVLLAYTARASDGEATNNLRGAAGPRPPARVVAPVFPWPPDGTEPDCRDEAAWASSEGLNCADVARDAAALCRARRGDQPRRRDHRDRVGSKASRSPTLAHRSMSPQATHHLKTAGPRPTPAPAPAPRSSSRRLYPRAPGAARNLVTRPRRRFSTRTRAGRASTAPVQTSPTRPGAVYMKRAARPISPPSTRYEGPTTRGPTHERAARRWT